MHSNWSCCPEQLMNKGYNLHIVCEYNTPKSVSHYNPQNVPQPIKMATLNYNSQPATSSMCINWKTKHDGPATPTPFAHRSYGRGPEPIGGSITHCTEPLSALHQERITLLITVMTKFPVVLGFPWIHTHEPQIYWAEREITRTSRKCPARIRPMAFPLTIPMTTPWAHSRCHAPLHLYIPPFRQRKPSYGQIHQVCPETRVYSSCRQKKGGGLRPNRCQISLSSSLCPSSTGRALWSQDFHSTRFVQCL